MPLYQTWIGHAAVGIAGIGRPILHANMWLHENFIQYQLAQMNTRMLEGTDARAMHGKFLRGGSLTNAHFLIGRREHSAKHWGIGRYCS